MVKNYHVAAHPLVRPPYLLVSLECFIIPSTQLPKWTVSGVGWQGLKWSVRCQCHCDARDHTIRVAKPEFRRGVHPIMLRSGIARLLTGYRRSGSSNRSSSSRSVSVYPSISPLKTRAMASLADERYLADKAAPICKVEISKAFSQLTFVSLHAITPCL